ncbi:MAG: RHS repeat-associated core domain-containing protein [Sedimentisphaerales bacterium]|jgi:RHS repeat-associated protein
MDNHTTKPASSQQGISTKATIVERYSYDVFGKPTIRGPSNEPRATSLYGNRFMFTGREYDSETANYYYRARYYSPKLGRFLQTDPIGHDTGLNLYTYCKNNPFNRIDPSGEADIGAAQLYRMPMRWGAQYAYGNTIYSNHWQVLYNDGTNSGYFGGNSQSGAGGTPVFGQDPHRTNQDYRPFKTGLDDQLLRQAESIVQERWRNEGQQYDFLNHSCQTYILEVLREYRMLQQLQQQQQQQLKPKKGSN